MTASKFMMLLILCIGTNSSEVTSMAEVIQIQISDVIYHLQQLSWEKIVIVHDSDSDEQASELVSQLERFGDILFTVVSLSRSEENDFLLLIYRKHLYKFMNIVRLIATGCAFTGSSSELVPSGTSEILLHTKSKWLIFPTNWCSPSMTFRFQTNLTNVAVVIPSSSQCIGILTLNGNIFESVPGTSTDEKIFPNIRYKLNGQKIIIGVVPDNPFEKNYYNILHTMSRYLNFTYDIVNSTNGEYGILTNGSWSGLIGQLVSHEIDLGLATLTPTVDRREAVDIVHPFGTSKPATYTATLLRSLVPKQVKPFETIQDLLDLPGWQIGVLSSTSEVIILNTSKNVDVQMFWKSFKSRTQKDANIQSTDINVHMKRITRGKYAFVIADGRERMKLLGNCSLEFNNNLFDMLDTEYSMAVPQGSLLKTELEDFIDKIKNSGLLEELMKPQDNRPSQCGVIDQTVKPLFFSTDLNVHMKKVSQGKYAFLTSYGHHLLKIYGDCSLDFNDHLLDLRSTDYSMAVQKGSLLKSKLDDFIDKIENSGLLEEIMKPQDNRPSQCRVIDQTVKPLFLDNIKGVFVLLAGVVVIAGITLVIDIVLHYKLHVQNGDIKQAWYQGW
ncbi:hypothetical protein LOTGIDRAFT_171765 [Lottia gigantea]|uniref:Ionotropic glutamate receptor L-glutamate and glycine-binding domain-containing protein n=1 Tax=Lottia gigantea TaxID=225164 RepID=V4CKC1_LOTGI|nr:hypothetical protein LOTGIDRAFT_171765 [Lottia gigantea]ESP02690.1 hypothetical protein LOTGIDRAFT_171765 [Lottia gigantea]